jgi:hypothetical protein
MRSVTADLIYSETLLYEKKIKKIKKKDPELFSRIKKVVRRLLLNPQIWDHPYHGSKKCKFVKYVGKDLARILYTWCAYCRSIGCPRINDCFDCAAKTNNTLRVFDVYYKHEARDLGYEAGKK